MKNLIGITGFATAGKDTAADYLVKEYGYTRVAFADPMREMLYATNPIINAYVVGIKVGFVRLQELVDFQGWEATKIVNPEVRELLQRLGTEAGRKVLGDTIWTDTLLKKVEAIDGDVVIADVRFEDEAIATRAHGGKVIRITRPGVKSVNDHVSDKGIPDTFVDYEISNNGTIKELEIKIEAIIKPYPVLSVGLVKCPR